MDGPTRRSGPHDRPASHQTPAKKSVGAHKDTPTRTPRQGWDDGTTTRDEGWWASVLEHVDAYAPKVVR